MLFLDQDMKDHVASGMETNSVFSEIWVKTRYFRLVLWFIVVAAAAYFVPGERLSMILLIVGSTGAVCIVILDAARLIAGQLVASQSVAEWAGQKQLDQLRCIEDHLKDEVSD